VLPTQALSTAYSRPPSLPQSIRAFDDPFGANYGCVRSGSGRDNRPNAAGRVPLSTQRIHLKAIGPELAGQTWTSHTRLRVGRVPGLEMALEHSSVSRHHAEISPVEQGWVVRDLGSTNGTLLNGVRIGQPGRELRPGDLLQFGQIATTVSFLGARILARQTDGDPETESSLSLSPSLRVCGAAGLPQRGRLTHRVEGQDVVLQTVTALAQAVELRDKYTGGHAQRVTNYALLLAERLGLSPADRRILQVGVPLHDIGKIGVDDAILRKPGALEVGEFESMRSHTVRGAGILAGIPGLAAVLPIVRSHHERWDGRGYPDGLAGQAIPLLARLVALADAFDAMTSDRPYRKAMPLDRAFAEIAAGAGGQFDPCCATAWLSLRPCLEELLQQRQSVAETYEPSAWLVGRASF
jgi:HD-GYP domain-containing protein (c-di-GMP phosphodiesterase class II)